jgi:hypothetical protein
MSASEDRRESDTPAASWKVMSGAPLPAR